MPSGPEVRSIRLEQKALIQFVVKKCLGCDEAFKSENKFNRLCRKCRRMAIRNFDGFD